MIKAGDWVFDASGNIGSVVKTSVYGSVRVQRYVFTSSGVSNRSDWVDVKTLTKAPVEVDIDYLIDMALSMRDEAWFYELINRIRENR